jgi:RNA polymerase sigma-70 factor (ECF subfamily)
MKVYKGIKRFRGDCGLKTWIYKIAMSECLNRRRWWQRWRHHVIFSLDEPVTISQNPHVKRWDVPDSQPGPELACAAKEMEQAVQKALATLNFDYRMVVVLRDIEGMAYEEIAETMNVSLGTVKSRLWRGRLELKAKLQGMLDQPL